MSTPESIPHLQAAAARLLPGLEHARSSLDASIGVLEYFKDHAMQDVQGTRSGPLEPAEPKLVEEVEQIKALLTAFGRLHGKAH